MSEANARLSRRLRIYCEVSAIAAVGVGSLVLYGWLFHFELLKSVLPGLVAMKANTALGLVFSGISLWLVLPSESRGPRIQIARFSALLVTLIGAATLSEYVFGLNLRIDELLFREPTGALATYSPGRMAPTTSTAFVAIGLALLLLDWKTRRGQKPAQVLSLWVALVAMMAISGYIYHAIALYRILLYTQVALHTAIALFLLSFGIFFARPGTGIAGDLTSDASGGVMARRFLPAVFIIPLALGWIRLQGQLAGLYGTELGLALYATSNICVFAVLVWLSAKRMNQEHKQRSVAEVAIRELNADLEVRVAERTNALERQAAVLTEQTALLDLANNAIIVRDMQGRIVFWNRGAETMYGWPAKLAVGKTTFELLKAEIPQPIEEIETQLAQQGHWEGESIHYTRDGTRLNVDIRGALQRGENGAPVRILLIANDISGRKQAESNLLMSSERLSLATAVAKMGVWEWDPATNIVQCDKTMFEIYGFPTIDAISNEKWSAPTRYERFTAAIYPEDLPQVEATLQRAIAEKGQGSAEFRVRLVDGSTRYISAIERVILDERGNVKSLIGMNMDVTKRKVAEEALEQSRKDQLRFKDEFLSHVSHELRSPLTAIKQFTTILLGGLAGELNQEQREYQQIVLKNIRQLQSMIDDLLEVTRLETGKLSVEPESVSISNALADTVDTLQGTARAKGVALSCDLSVGLPSVRADPTRLRQILIILVDNAIKFTPGGGIVKIQARVLPQDPQFLLLEVSDTGRGIHPEIIERIFERLYQVLELNQASRKGLGLGLYICKELVTRQGGQIWVKSEPEKGSTFSFTLPVFSLNETIAPLLKDDKWPGESIALVTVEICMLDPWPSKESQEEWSHEVRNLVQRCLLPDLDVLLPKMSSGTENERFFVAAFANEKGASVLVNRIREQFERLPRRPPGRTLSVTYTMLEPFPPEVGASMENIVTNMATNLEESIKSQNSLEAIHHE